MFENAGLRSLGLAVLLCALAAVSRPAGAAGNCSPLSPPDQLKKTPQTLWGEIQPVGIILDATRYNGNQRADSLFPQATSVDVENGYLFASYWAGFGIWDLRTTPDAPVLLSLIDGWKGGFPKWSGVSETDQFLYTIDAPAGDDSIFALGGIAPAGLSIWDARSKSAPVLLYQDFNKDIAQVYAATIGGRAYAFAGGAFSGNEFGLFIYDMTRARANNNACSEDASGSPRPCTGVYITKIDTGGGPVQYVHGLQFGARHFVVTSPGQGSVHGVQIWDVTNPAVPKQVVTGFTASGLATFTSGVALWQQNNSAFLAIRFQDNLQVFDLTACLTAGCSALPGPIVTQPVAAVTESNYWKTLSFSRAGGTPMLFLGNQLFCHAGQGPGHVEYVLDMTNPAQPRDITPPGTTVYALPSAPASSELVDYWSYYYRDDIKGFFELASRDAKLYQAPSGRTFLYRAGVTLFDVHEWVGRNPAPGVANVTPSPAAPLVCQPVTFTANGVTGRPPLTLSWSVTNGAAATVATGTGNPFIWTTVGMPPGSYTAKVTVHNGLGPNAPASAPVPLGALGTLASTGPPIKDPFTGKTVTFHAQAKAATEWNWSFGGAYQGWSSIADPTFTFAAAGTYPVKVKIRNCLQATEIESAPLTVVIGDSVVIQTFQAQCNVAPCSFSATVPITFSQAVLGNPAQLQYDWDGNGTFDQTVAVTGAVADSISHTYAAAGQYGPVIRAVRGVEPPVDFRHPTITVGSGGGQLTIDGPGTGTTNSPLTFTATAVSCTPAATWSWNPAGGVLSGTGSQVTISWPTAGTKAVSVTNSGCGAATGHLAVSIADGLGASFKLSPAAPIAGQAVSFDGSASTGGPVSFAWDFGDGQTANSGGATASHTYAAAGTYTVKLEVGKPGSGCPFGVCSAVTARSVTVLPGGPQTQAAVSAQAGTPVSFTATPANATSYAWSFGDGGTATGAQVTHTWTQNGTFTVQLTASGGPSPVTSSLTVVVSGAPVKKAVIVPWAAQDATQSSDLYLFNPAASPIGVTLTFFVRGPAEANPPKSSSTIPPGSTLFVPNAVGSLFNRPGATGFITVTVDTGGVGAIEPVVTLFNTTAKADGSTYGQTISGVSMSSIGSQGSPATPPARHLVGLGNNAVLISSFGVSNPGPDTQAYTLRIFDSTGKAVGTPQSFSVARSSQRQFLPKEIQTLFGVSNLGDYRVEIQSGGGQLVPFSTNLLNGSNDPSFVGAVTAAPAKVHLLGALSLPGAGGSSWQTDVVLANPSAGVVTTDVIYTGTGPTAAPTAPLHLTLQPGETRRLPDLIGTQWGLRNTVGAITLSSASADGIFPVVQGQSTNSTNPAKRLGQLMPAMDESQAAGVNASQVLAGLRQDAKYSTNVWIFNPGSAQASVDVVYLGLDGHEIGRTAAFAVGPGAIRQIILAQKLPAGGAVNGLTVQVQVKSGKILAAAQVVNTGTNDPAYVLGVTR